MILAVALLSLIYFQPSFWNESSIEAEVNDGSWESWPALQMSWFIPFGVTVDGDGNLYLADHSHHRIRRVDNSGIVTTVAGNGSHGFSGDGGPATQARMFYPRIVSMDSMGCLYIADGNNNRIRKVDGSGIITTVAGNGVSGFSGDGGPATQACLKNPNDVALDISSNLYIADTINFRIRKVDCAGIITTVAGNGDIGFDGDGGPAVHASLNYPFGITLDGDGNLYIADSGNHHIRKVDSSGIITTIAGNGKMGFNGDGGPAVHANLFYPFDVSIDTAGNLYIVDTDNNRIRRVDGSGIITTVAGNGLNGFSGDDGPATLARLNYPRGMSVDNESNLYIADTMNDRIRKVDREGIITTVVWNGYATFGWYGGSATIADTNYP